MGDKKTKRSDRLLDVLNGRKVVIVTHDNPDPDAIAAGWALHKLVRAHGLEARLIGRGGIERAENLHMVRLLEPPLSMTSEPPSDAAAVILVDCVPPAANHLLHESDLRPVAVLDHHELNGHKFRVKYRDIRPSAAATASIAAGYLRERGLEPESNLATAMLYAIGTETSGCNVRLTRADRGIITWLSGYADHTKLASINNAPLSRPYFSDLLLALESTFVYDGAAVSFLPRASGPEIVGEVADMLIRCEGVDRVLCAAAVDDDVFFSARTTPSSGDAVAQLGAAIRGLGHWGGHKRRAGGKIPNLTGLGKTYEALSASVKERWLTNCKVDQQRGTRLVRRQAILQNL